MFFRGTVLFLIGGILSVASGQCSDNINTDHCSYDCEAGQLVCQYSLPSGPPRSVVLTIDQCSDPLDLTLTVYRNDTGHLSIQNYQVGGPVEFSQCRGDGHVKITTTYSRDASHLYFSASGVYFGDIAVELVPQFSLSLNPHRCMCQSLNTVAENFQLSLPVPGFTLPFNHSCVRDDACSHVTCTFSNSAGSSDMFIIIDPCEEAVIVMPNTQEPGTEGQLSFNRTEARELTQGGYTATIYMTLTNYNYSMEFSTEMSLQNVPVRVTIYEPTKITLDRSICTGDITYYEGEPIPVSACTSGPWSTSPTPPINTPPITTPLVTGHVHTDTSGASTQPQPTVPASCAGGGPLNGGCQHLPDCPGITCSSNFSRSFVVIDKCSDPVSVDLTVNSAQSNETLFKAKFFIGGPEIFYRTESTRYYVESGRNSTHLKFSAVGFFFEDSKPDVILKITEPLEPHNCMCDSLTAVASTVSAPLAPLTCHRDDLCTSIQCFVSGSDGNEPAFRVQVLPCEEAIVIIPEDNSQVEQQKFTQTEDRVISSSDGPPATLSVFLNNHNFSMDLQVTLSTVLNQQEVPVFSIPRTRISLDRSLCSEQQLNFYSGEPPKPIISIDNGNGYSPAPVPGVSLTAIAVAVPLVLVISLALIVGVVVGVVLVLRTKRRRVGGYAFSELREDDNDEV